MTHAAIKFPASPLHQDHRDSSTSKDDSIIKSLETIKQKQIEVLSSIYDERSLVSLEVSRDHRRPSEQLPTTINESFTRELTYLMNLNSF